MRCAIGLMAIVAAACSGGSDGTTALDATPPVEGSYSVRAVVPVRFDSSPTNCVIITDPPPRPGCRTDTTSVYVITGTVTIGKPVAGSETGSWSATSALSLSVTRYGADLQPAEAARRCSAQPAACWLAMAPADARAMASWPAGVTVVGEPSAFNYGWTFLFAAAGWDAGHELTTYIEYRLRDAAGTRYYDSTAARTLEVVKR